MADSIKLFPKKLLKKGNLFDRNGLGGGGGGWVWGSRIVAVQFISRPHTLALAFVCPREEWCVLSARAIATLIRAYLPPAAGTACDAACIAINVHHQPLKFHTRRLQHGNAWVETSGGVGGVGGVGGTND